MAMSAWSGAPSWVIFVAPGATATVARVAAGLASQSIHSLSFRHVPQSVSQKVGAPAAGPPCAAGSGTSAKRCTSIACQRLNSPAELWFAVAYRNQPLAPLAGAAPAQVATSPVVWYARIQPLPTEYPHRPSAP